MLTDTAVKAIATPDKDQLIPAGGRDGLYLRVRTTGRKTWVIRRRVDGKWRVLTLGDFPKVTARVARNAASTDQAPAVAITFKDAAADFCKEVIEARYRNAPQESAAYFTRDCRKLNPRRLDRVRRGDLVAIIRAKAADRPNAAVKLLALLKQFFRWSAIGELIEANPLAGVTAQSLNLPAYEPRERVLTDEEIRWVWALPDEPYGRLLRFVTLTACRIGEAIGFNGQQLAGDVWTIPKTKNNKPHSLPLPPLALELAEQGWPPRGYQALYSFLKEREVTWRPHDLRRTAATRMRNAGVAIEIIEAVLNHAPPRLVRIYQRPDLMPAMRVALTTLEHALQEVTKQQ